MPASPTCFEANAAVLAVDDLTGELEALRAACRSAHMLIAARSTDEGLAQIESQPDLLAVLAVHGDGIDGARLLREVRSRRPACRRVLIVRPSAGGAPLEILDAIDACRPHRVLRGWPDAAALGALLDELVDGSRRAHARQGRGGARDPVTGLYCPVGFEERLREELARARRYGKPLSLLIGSVERAGDPGGRALVDRVAGLFTAPDHAARLRESDVVGRFGPDGIAVMLPETSKEGAAVKADRVRVAVEEALADGGPVRMSIGIAGFPDDAGTSADLLGCADQALAAARASGSSCVRLSIGSQESPAEVGRRRVALDPDDLAVLRRERFATYHVRLFDVVSALRRDHSLSCLFVDLSELRRVEREVGPTHHAELLGRAGELLEGMRGDRLGARDLICRTEDQDGYLCFLASPRQVGCGSDLEALASRVEEVLERELSATATSLARELPRIGVGFSRVLDNPLVRPERLLARLVADSHRSALLHRERASQRHKALLQEIILRGRLRAVYQPIVDLDSGQVFGFEGLARGPSESALESPTALFSVAEQVDLTFELDRACFRSALAGAVGLQPIHRLFLNLLPTSFYDSSFIEREVSTLLEAASITPANVVFEITERLAIEDFASFRRALACYTRAGFGVAIDDVGTRHSNLESVMALRPNFLKLSDVLTRGVSTSTVKREMVRSLQRIAEAIDAVIVAEGIERPEDLAVLCDLGVKFGQGYLLARPGPPFPEVQMVRRRTGRGSLTGAPTRSLPILGAPWWAPLGVEESDRPVVPAPPAERIEPAARADNWLSPPWMQVGDECAASSPEGAAAQPRSRRRPTSSSESFGDEETTNGRRR